MSGGNEAFWGPTGRRRGEGGGWRMLQRMQEIDGAEVKRPKGEGTNRPAGEILLHQMDWEEEQKNMLYFPLYNCTTTFWGQMFNNAGEMEKRWKEKVYRTGLHVKMCFYWLRGQLGQCRETTHASTTRERWRFDFTFGEYPSCGE